MSNNASKNYPLVQVGMPIYNGGKYLEIALGAVVAQDYPNFEIIVVDNASTDNTVEIVREFMKTHKNIRLYINEKHIGLANGRKPFELSDAPYFLWAAHDDKFEPTFISKTVAVLEQHPEAVLCNGLTRFMDENGNTIPGPNNNEIHTLGMNTTERVSSLCAKLGWFASYSMMRADMLRKVKLDFTDNTFGSDVIFLEEFALLGNFILLPEVLFNYRIVHTSVSQTMVRQSDPSGKRPTFYTDLAKNLLDMIAHTDLPDNEKQVVRESLFKTVCFKNTIWHNLFIEENYDYFKNSMQNCNSADNPDKNEVETIFRNLVFNTKLSNPQFEGYVLRGCVPVSQAPFGFNIIYDSDSLEENAKLREDIQLLRELLYPISLVNIIYSDHLAGCDMPYAVNLFYISDNLKFVTWSSKLQLKNRLNVLAGSKNSALVTFDHYAELLNADLCKSYYDEFLKKISALDIPLISNFIELTTKFVEQGKYSEGLQYYTKYREFYESNATMREFDALMGKLRNKLS
ncbi:MAG: glycosyltransferase family 2 protein [Fibrobacteres bacterium]|nr:glycosyltransferase family 2 protein [Fibrobacterota bacterium]